MLTLTHRAVVVSSHMANATRVCFPARAAILSLPAAGQSEHGLKPSRGQFHDDGPGLTLHGSCVGRLAEAVAAIASPMKTNLCSVVGSDRGHTAQ